MEMSKCFKQHQWNVKWEILMESQVRCINIHNKKGNWENETNRIEGAWEEVGTSQVYQISVARSLPSD